MKTGYTKELQKGPSQSSWMFLFYIYDFKKKDNPFTYKHSSNDVHATLCTNLHICLIYVKIFKYLYTYTN